MSRSALPLAGRVASRLVPMTEGEPCGDAAACIELGASGTGGKLLAIVDGLGHGSSAAEAALAAMNVLHQHAHQPLAALMERLDAALRDTRGAAVGLLRLDGDLAQHAGVGNTRAIRWRAERLDRWSSQPGIVGGWMPRSVLVTEMDVEPDDWFLLFTDGLDERLQLPARLPEWQRDPAALCDHLLQRWRVGQDDCGVLVLHVRERG